MTNILKKIISYFTQIDKQETASDYIEDDSSTQLTRAIDFSYFYRPDNLFTDEFYSNLARTINWTEKIIDTIEDKTEINFSTILRLANPNYTNQPFYSYDGTSYSFAATSEIPFDYRILLEEAMKTRKIEESRFENINQLGQIIEFEIDLTTHDGAPCAESYGFVDESDIPPIDCWFYLTKTYLYCWIPSLFIEPMQRAIDVEIFDSYRWLKDSNPDLQRQIVERLKCKIE